MTCRMCGGQQLYQFLDLGGMPPADQFRCADRLHEPEISYPLQVLMCEDCGLAQLGSCARVEASRRCRSERGSFALDRPLSLTGGAGGLPIGRHAQ